tara:strand:- start:158 stop:451 length:294 start_codon:yes stop_codon:yes gene_type:complete
VKKEEAKFEELKNKFPHLDKFAGKQDMQKNLIALFSPEFFEKYKLPDDSYLKEFNDPNALIEGYRVEETIQAVSIHHAIKIMKAKYGNSARNFYVLN